MKRKKYYKIGESPLHESLHVNMKRGGAKVFVTADLLSIVKDKLIIGTPILPDSFQHEEVKEELSIEDLFDIFLKDESQPFPELRKKLIDAEEDEEIDDKISEKIQEAFVKFLREKGYKIKDD